MPIDQETGVTNGFEKSRLGWFEKCLPSLVVRGRESPDQDPNRIVMRPANAKDKKRKRSFRSLSSVRKESEREIPFAMLEKDEVEREQNRVKSTFDSALDATRDQKRYQDERSRLLHVEALTAWDAAARETASQIERIAGLIISSVREYEREFVFGNLPSESLPQPWTRDMGGQFLTNKPRIEKWSKLFVIAQMVPKGGLLHLHFNAELHPERLIEEARSIPTMFIRSIRPLLTEKDLDETEIVFNVMPEDTPSNDIFLADYNGTAKNFKDPAMQSQIWMRWKDFCDRFKALFGKEHKAQIPNAQNGTLPNSSEQGPVKLNPAENWVKQKMVLSEEEAYRVTQTVNGVWARFNQATRAFKGLLNYEQVYLWYISNAIDRMIEEKIMYAELRPMLLDKFIPTTDGTGKIDNAGQMRLILEGVRRKRAELEIAGKGDLFPFGLKIIYCTPRSIPLAMMRNEMKHCIDLKVEFPELICGFDLVGAEDRPNNIGFYYQELIAFKKTCRERGLDIPFLFHAGETLLDTGGSSDPGKSNLYDAVILEAKRIGHGFSLLKHPHLMEKFKKTRTNPGICIELCPISNELLHLCRNVKQHPFPQLLAAGIPCTVNSDNPSLFSNSMSHEFYQIMVGAPTMTIHSWKQLGMWSLEYSCLPELDKAKGKKIFLEKWETFCHDVVEQYSHLFDAQQLSKGKATIDKEKAHEFFAVDRIMQESASSA